MFALTPTELHRLADQIRRAARHGQLKIWADQDLYEAKIVDVVQEGEDPAYVEITLDV